MSNPVSRLATAIGLIQCKHRLLLTASPLPSDLAKLRALVALLLPRRRGTDTASVSELQSVRA